MTRQYNHAVTSRRALNQVNFSDITPYRGKQRQRAKCKSTTQPPDKKLVFRDLRYIPYQRRHIDHRTCRKQQHQRTACSNNICSTHFCGKYSVFRAFLLLFGFFKNVQWRKRKQEGKSRLVGYSSFSISLQRKKDEDADQGCDDTSAVTRKRIRIRYDHSIRYNPDQHERLKLRMHWLFRFLILPFLFLFFFC